MIKLKNISIGYSSELFSIEDLELEKGQLYSLIGKNGSGKTTLIETIIGEKQTLSGKLLVNNVSVNELTKKEKVKTFAHVPSKFNGVQHLTVRELIGMGRAPFTNILGQLSKVDHDKIDKIISLLNLNELADKDTTAISDGERQITMIGRALAQESNCILLDEPTAFLDYSNRLIVMQILKKIATEENKLILISSHDLDITLQYSDLILAVNQQSKKLNSYSKGTTKETIISEIFL